MTRSPLVFTLIIFLALIVVQLVFSGYAIIIRAFAQSHDVHPIVLSLVRDVGTFPVLLVAARFGKPLQMEKQTERETHKDRKRLRGRDC